MNINEQSVKQEIENTAIREQMSNNQHDNNQEQLKVKNNQFAFE